MDLAESDLLHGTGKSPARQTGHIQVFNEDQIEFVNQAARERMHRSLTCIPYLRMRPRHPKPLFLTSTASLLASRKTTLLLP